MWGRVCRDIMGIKPIFYFSLGTCSSSWELMRYYNKPFAVGFGLFVWRHPVFAVGNLLLSRLLWDLPWQQGGGMLLLQTVPWAGWRDLAYKVDSCDFPTTAVLTVNEFGVYTRLFWSQGMIHNHWCNNRAIACCPVKSLSNRLNIYRRAVQAWRPMALSVPSHSLRGQLCLLGSPPMSDPWCFWEAVQKGCCCGTCR